MLIPVLVTRVSAGHYTHSTGGGVGGLEEWSELAGDEERGVFDLDEPPLLSISLSTLEWERAVNG